MAYTPKEIMVNLAWQWRNHYDVMLYSLNEFAHAEFGGPDRALNNVWSHQKHSPSVQGMYGDFVLDNGIPPFFELVISSAYDDHPSNLQLCTQYIDNYSKTIPVSWYNIVKDNFSKNLNVYGMHSLLVHAPDGGPDRSMHEVIRATYRDNRSELIQIIMNY